MLSYIALAISLAVFAKAQDVVHNVPLVNLEHLSLSSLENVLSTTGLFAVDMSGTADFEAVRELALEGLCDCEHDMSAVVESTDSAILSDGVTKRTTLATATIGTTPLPLPQQLGETCGPDTAQAMDDLRDYLAMVSQTFVQAVDTRLRNQHVPLLRDVHGVSYTSLQSIVKASTNLEHFHVYSKRNDEKEEEEVLKLHTDAGLFLAFVPALSCHHPRDDSSSGFYIYDGTTKRVIFPENSIAIMMGAGAEHWLKNLPIRLAATKHAVKMKAGSKRAWYGTMHLVPQNAIVQESPLRTFSDMRKTIANATNQKFGDDPHNNDQVSIGCGNAPIVASEEESPSLPSIVRTTRRRLQHVSDASVCNNVTNFFCWMSCLDIPDSDNAEVYVNEGYSLYCADPAVLAATGNKVSAATEPCNNNLGEVGKIHNANCMGTWQPTAPGGVRAATVRVNVTSVEQPFCYGGTSMYMEGFQWLGTTCIIYLFPAWVLSTPGKLAVACIGTLFVCLSLEGIIRYRRVLVQGMKPGWKRLSITTVFYGAQLTVGYFIMLVVMTYSGPLFLCVVVGLMGGHFVFNARDMVRKQKQQGEEEEEEECCQKEKESDESNFTSHSTATFSRRNSENMIVPEGSTPCCQYTL